MGQILRVTLRWSIAWTILGTIAGVLMMLGRVPPIAESGAKPSELSFYAFWIPILGVAAGAFGFALGLVFSTLMALSAKWRTSVEARPDIFGRYGPRVLCGAAAGGLVALPLFHDANALFFAGLGFLSATVSSAMHWRALRSMPQKSQQGG